MEHLKFEWDDEKARLNEIKHKITFEEAKSAFYDDSALVYFDPDNSDDEDRFILLGSNHQLKVIVVCHCIRGANSKIRIISARKADKSESKEYWENHL